MQTEVDPVREIDFVKKPSNEYFCPVTSEVLLQPHKTQCCGNHLSEYAVSRIQAEENPCPQCKEMNWSTTLDEHFKDEVHKLQVYCFHKKSGCKWEGELGALDRHEQSCASNTNPQETLPEVSNQEQVCPMHILTSFTSFMNCIDL